MAKTQSTYPIAIDTTLQTDRASGDTITSASYDVIEDALFELETKVGVDSSAVNTTLDYKLKNVASINPGHLHSQLSALDGIPTSAVYCDNSGNVGIGCTPSTLLDVYGNINILNQVSIGRGTFGADGCIDIAFDNQRALQIARAGSSKNSFMLHSSQSAGGATQWWTYGINLDNTFRINPGVDSINSPAFVLDSGGRVGIGKSPAYQLELSTDSAGKPGIGGLWTVVSDERIKKDIQLADLDRCYEIVKEVPLKYFGWADGVYTEEQVKDRHNLGWISQDVQKVFPKATNIIPFKKADEEVIADCLDLNGGQMMMAMYGAIQKLIQKVETLEQDAKSIKEKLSE